MVNDRVVVRCGGRWTLKLKSRVLKSNSVDSRVTCLRQELSCLGASDVTALKSQPSMLVPDCHGRNPTFEMACNGTRRYTTKRLGCFADAVDRSDRRWSLGMGDKYIPGV